jgi:ADP-ribose pyrophosphatase YjhB (NUDIX family)
MTFALSFDSSTNTTSAFFGFQTSGTFATPGQQLVSMIQDVPEQIQDPMLIPALCYGLWTDIIQGEHSKVALHLREVQEKTGLMHDYLRQQKVIEDTVNFDAVHRNLVLQHAYLTNGIADFVLSLGPATINAIQTIEAQSLSGFNYDSTEAREYVEHTQLRAGTEMQHRQRMLDRINMYLQVVSHPSLPPAR